MYAFCPATLFPCPSTPQNAVPPLKTKPPNNSFKSSCKLFYNKQDSNLITTQLSVNSRLSACDQTSLLDDWPQLLQISIGSRDLIVAQAIHGYLVKSGYQNDAFRGNNLINMYAKFSRLDDAQLVFDKMLDRNTITWTSLINGYSQSNDVESVFRIAHDMHRLQEEFNEHTCSVILRACELPEDWIRGEQIHGFVIKKGFCEDVVVATSLISMYSRSGYLGDAVKLFNDLTYKDIRCFNFMISEHGKMGHGKKAICLFHDLLSLGLEPNDYTFTNLISACNGDNGMRRVGRQLHGCASKHGLMGETSVGNAMITLYGKHGMVEEAESVFHAMDERNLVSWTALLSVYVKNGCGEKALGGFLDMFDLGIYIDSSCLATVLDGCSECKNLGLGLQIHGFVIKLGFLSDINVGTALIDLYAKCRNLQSARLVFNGLSVMNTTSFNAILVGFTERDGGDEDFMVLFSQLRLAGIKPDSVTFAQLLTLAADQACLGNAVITMYAKCGSIEDAYQVFSGMRDHDTISWNAMVSAYALHGQGEEAVMLFEEMIEEGFIPDEITIVGVLQACCYSGLWDHGLCLFNEMEVKYGIQPVFEHCACVVGLLGRAGHFAEAMDFINKSPFSDSPLLWRTLVHACKIGGDLSFGKIASQHLLDLSPKEAGSYMVVSNMYAGGGMLDEAARVRTIMNDLKIRKEAGCSWIEIDKKTHLFVASSKDHPKSRDIYAKLELLKVEMKQICDDGTDFQLILESV
ncbi:hypothetical protein F0562_015672 [Nyssa sinensis]|uniref:DYW domain-containing protein n=1 Tax=Nyssa sinensis TaxID=561372 RepID=A0A5J4ZKT9_9ASTE|nr:hypothetical protein F0562_015672 [Nyssa sinensis]